MEDNHIVDLYWLRDENAITETKGKYGNYCFSIANNILHNNEDAEECVCDTWYQTWTAIPPKRPDSLRFFLAKLTRNISFNRFCACRAQKRGGGEIHLVLEELAECIACETDIEEEYNAKELGRCIQLFVAALPARDANIFVRRYFYTEKVATIASRYGLSQNNVTVILHRTRQKLKLHLIKEGYIIEQRGFV